MVGEGRLRWKNNRVFEVWKFLAISKLWLEAIVAVTIEFSFSLRGGRIGCGLLPSDMGAFSC